MLFWVLTAKFAPQNCGVGEQTELLLEQLRAGHGLEGGVLVASPQWQAEKAPALPVCQSWNGDPPADAKVMLLQYSGYGFARRGAPVGLVMQMRRMRRCHPGLRLVTMFHELFAYGPPTSSSFWYSPLQRWVAVSLAKLSDRVITNRTGTAQWLERRVPGHRCQICVSPVFSNLGEVSDAPPPSQREAHLVFFGYQAELWDAGFDGLRSVLEKLKPSRVTILGRSAEIPAEVFGGVTVTRTGYLGAEEVSTILRTARWGLVAYNPEYLGKSSLVAAFMAHGVVSLLVDGHLPLSEGLERGVHLLAVNDLGSASPDLDAISAAGQHWYRPHNRENTAAAFAKLLLGA
jgi:hypothetical protein